MKNFVLKIAFVSCFIVAWASEGLATTCTQPDDWINAVCKYDPLVPNERCWTDPVSAGNMAAQCSPAVVDCHLTPEGACFGTVQPDHWIVTGTADSGIRRCRCGCFAQDTQLTTNSGTIQAISLLEKQNEALELAVNSGFDDFGLDVKPINGLISGPEGEDAYTFTLKSGRSITVSKAHPMMTVDQGSKISLVKSAQDIVVGDNFSAESGGHDAVVAINKGPYGKLMINFNVASNNAMEHFVFANGVRAGDNAWQQYLASEERRILKRNDILMLVGNAKG
ncbi:MAG: hypothetical protein M3Q07_09005 [Pseudobdellovibrionaceae bacterium]|nr:hypothetical protein [Pseudobdellovibrionaceae bacterium]